MLHNLLITLHAMSGIVSFLFGCTVLKPPASNRDWKFQFYYCAMLGLIVFLAAAVLIDWTALTGIQRLIYTGLTCLGLYTFRRTHSARNKLVQRSADWQKAYIDDVGFTLISLFDGFAIVSAIDLHAPAPVSGIVAAAGVAIGIAATSFIKNRILYNR